MMIPISAISAVMSSALIGSPFFVVTLNTSRNGIILSLAIACSNRGAPAKKTKEFQIEAQKISERQCQRCVNIEEH